MWDCIRELNIYMYLFIYICLQILESLPTSGALKRNDGESLLGHLIGETAGWDLTRAEEQNLLTFVKYLFEVSYLVLCVYVWNQKDLL